MQLSWDIGHHFCGWEARGYFEASSPAPPTQSQFLFASSTSNSSSAPGQLCFPCPFACYLSEIKGKVLGQDHHSGPETHFGPLDNHLQALLYRDLRSVCALRFLVKRYLRDFTLRCENLLAIV